MKPALSRVPLVFLGILALLAAMWAGLIRIGWQFPPLAPGLAAHHGPLMISGFLGTVINLERAVALNDRRYLLAPLLCGLGALALITGLAPMAGIVLVTLGSLGLVVIFGVIVRRHPARFTITMALAALFWFVGNLLWLANYPIGYAVLWWIAFLVLTILGERLELARLMRLDRMSDNLYLLALAIVVVGLALTLAASLPGLIELADVGARIFGVGTFAIALWLARYDITRRTVRQTGLTRFIAWCLLVGYGWLAIGGVLRLVFGLSGGFQADAMLHTILLGFVISMIFGHAPIIFPAVIGRGMAYHSTFYVHLVLLHASLIVRVVGDLAELPLVRQWGGMFNVIAILVFLFMTARALRAGTAAFGKV